MSLLSHSPPSYDDAHNLHTTLTPYLQLPHLLSLTWLAYPILSLIFVAFRLQASLASSQDAIANTKVNLLASCRAAEEAATSAASMPRYMAIATNEQISDAVNASLRGARAALVMSLTVMEAIINFIIDLYRSIFLCFLELVVRGGLAILIGAVNEINNLLGTVTSGLRTRIQEDIGSINRIISGFVDTINRANPFEDIKAPQLDIPNLDGLENVSLPDSFQESLIKLNETIPTVSTIKEKLEEIINKPFELLKKDINDTFAGISFNSSTLPVPEQSKVSFCSDFDLSVVDDVGRDIVKTAKIGVIILIAIALVLIGLNCLLTWYKWRCMKSHLEYTRQAWNTDPTMHTKVPMSNTPQVTLTDHNLMVLQANSEHPLVTRITNQLSALLRLSSRNHTHLQWFCNYIFHPPAAACLLIGLFGIILVEIQLAAMGPLIQKYQQQAAETTKDFSRLIANSINENMLNQSTIYAAQVNAQVDAVQTTINDGLFGWVDGTVTPLNTTINEFYDDVQNAVKTVFGGTILETAATEFIRCIIGTKVDAIENALTFLHDNLKVDMPRVNDTALLLSPDSVNEAASPIAAAAMGGGTEDDQGLVGRLVNSYADTLRKERVTFGIFLALWGVVVLMGLCVLFWHSVGRSFLEKARRRRFEREHRGGLPDGFVVPFRDGVNTPPRDEKRGGGLAASGDLPEFTPLPSPRRSVFKLFWASRSNTPDVDQNQLASSNGRSIEEGGNKSRLKAFKLKSSAKGKSEKDTEQQEEMKDGAGRGWLGKVKGAFGKKEPEPEPDLWESFNSQPKLKIIVDTPADLSSTSSREQSQSRWSMSPDPAKTSWTKKLMSPPPFKKSPSTTSELQMAQVPSSLENKATVSSDNNAAYDPFAANTRPSLIIPTPYPIPLHSAYDNMSLAPQITQAPPRRFVAPYPPAPTSTHSSQSHRRTSSVPVWRVTNMVPTDRISNNSSTMSLDNPFRKTPAGPRRQDSPLNLTSDQKVENSMSRLLTANQAQESTSDPFITPFDDEHRVQIVPPPSDPRKSILTNPFSGVAI